MIFDNIHSRVGLKDTSNTITYFATTNEGVYFPSGKVYLTLEFLDIKAENTLILKSLNDQNLKKMAVDLLRPNIDIFIETVGKSYQMGETVVVSKAVGLDVLDPCVTTTLILILLLPQTNNASP